MAKNNTRSTLPEWLPIPGWPGYETNREGEVRSWKVRGKHLARASKPSRVIPFLHHGSWWVRLNDKDQRRQAIKIEELVKLALEGTKP